MLGLGDPVAAAEASVLQAPDGELDVRRGIFDE